ncbi:hypothetical protein [uncultured Nevskia sp.]|uniref:hypothetical protein n=1 Tax=uncultured Nevskia sp. TaxID=228950 RepID=UPI0025F2B9D1|nr:hypothetical protein [uncultured Nevskia sp.]
MTRLQAITNLVWSWGVLLIAIQPAIAGAAPTSILDLQPNKLSERAELPPLDGHAGRATLINLNPKINSWYVLRIDRDGGPAPRSYQLENADPARQTVHLNGDRGLLLSGVGSDLACDLWRPAVSDALDKAQESALPYAPLCNNHLYLRNVVKGTYTNIERITGFLRDHVWGGEKIIGFAKDKLYSDAFLEKANPAADAYTSSVYTAPMGAPPAAKLSGPVAAIRIAPSHLGLDPGTQDGLLPGRWYPVQGASGIYVSAIQPLAAYRSVPGTPTPAAYDPVEAGALDYLVAFDLQQLTLGFALGTDQPRLGWSARIKDNMRNAAMPGPDGIDSAAPLARTGMVSPVALPRIAAAFTGGFKREHGAFRYGALASRNLGSHYGFIEEGTVFSRLQSGMATLFVLDDGTVEMKTWTLDDNRLLPRIRHARQNGVPLVEPDASTGKTRPGALVAQWGAGNWSGSADVRQRTLRAGACLVRTQTQRFLIYGYFSSATPPAMAGVFQAYGCNYAMHLDMNALEHTYLAVYTRSGNALSVQHMVEGMDAVDRKGGDAYAPRFLAFPDDRDFFYLTRKQAAP